MRLFLDANVLFTAAYSPEGKVALLIGILGSRIVTSDFAAEEARRNLKIKKPAAVPRLEALLVGIEIVRSAVAEACPIELPKKDRPIYLTALRAGATHLLTGDRKDFGRHMNQPKKTGEIVIQSVGDFFDSI